MIDYETTRFATEKHVDLTAKSLRALQVTRTPEALYVHVLDAASTKLVLPGTAGLDVKKATYFGTDREVEINTGPGGELELSFPSDAVHPIDTIVVLGL